MAKNTQKSDLQDDEPSIEEILSSIRDIISDDDEKDTVKDPDNKAKSEDQSEEDILDLTELVTGDDAGKNVSEAKAVSDEDLVDDLDDPLAGINLAHPEDELDVTDSAFGVDHTEDNSSAVDGVQENEKLLDDMTEQATILSMSKLAQNIVVSRVAPDGVTLDDIVRDLLRPMLKNWLDDNLPDIIERLVEKELERLAEKAARK